MARQPRPTPPAGPVTVANTNNGPAVIAPWPLIDRYPTILGDRISIGYIGAVIRQCMSGYRQQWVDLLEELLVGEPHGYAVLEHRFNTVSGGRLDITPPELRPINGEPNPETDEAKLIADDIASVVDAIPDRQKALNRLAWGLYYGVSGAENIYEYRADGWRVVALNFIHSRRIAYPDQNSWRPRIWDQGSVSTSTDTNRSYPTTEMFGVRVDDFPGKFIIFEACIRGDYPTREGLGLQLAYWIGLKGMAVRGAGQYVERFGKPWALGSYSTAQPNLPKRAATDEDIKALNAALAALGLGSLAGAALPDSVEINLQGPGLNSGSTGITHAELIALIDAQIEEVVLTTSGITTPGKNGTRSSREVMKEGTRETFRYDAQCLADTLKRDLVMPLVRLRHPGKEHLCPNVAIFPNEEPNPLAILELNAKAAASGLPVDADAVAKKIGVDLVPAEKRAPPRRMYPVKPIPPVDMNAPSTSDEDKGDDDAAAANQGAADGSADKGPADTELPEEDDVARGEV